MLDGWGKATIPSRSRLLCNNSKVDVEYITNFAQGDVLWNYWVRITPSGE